MKNQKGFAQIILILVIVFVAIGGAYYFGTLKNKPSLVSVVPTSTPIVSPRPIAKVDDPTVNWKVYKNSKPGFSVKYPEVFQEQLNQVIFDSGCLVVDWTPTSNPNMPLFSRLAVNFEKLLSCEAGKTITYSEFYPKYQMILNENYTSKGKQKIGMTLWQHFLFVDNYETIGLGNDIYLTKNNGYIVAITRGSSAVCSTNLPDQILSTFKFTN